MAQSGRSKLSHTSQPRDELGGQVKVGMEQRVVIKPVSKFLLTKILKLILNMFLIWVVIFGSVQPCSACWPKGDNPENDCVASLRPNLLHIQEQYNGFLEAIKKLNVIARD